MKTSSKIIEYVLNFVSVIAAFVIIASLANWYLFSSPREVPYPGGPEPGTRVELPDLNWSKSSVSVVLALSVNCVYCSESTPFYQNLLNAASSRSLRTVAVFPQPAPEAEAYLREHGLAPTVVRQAKLRDIGVAATPSILLVDNSGRVLSGWVGKLTPEREEEVFKEIGAEVPPSSTQERSASDPADPNYLAAAEFKDLLRKESVVPVIDIRPREEYRLSHIADSLNIPLGELQPRAKPEIPKWPTVVLYCYDPSCSACSAGAARRKGLETRCTIAAFVMEKEGYSRVRLIEEELSKLKQAGIRIIEPSHKAKP